MSVQPVLGDWPVVRIQSLRSEELRRFAELPIPGRQGSLLQDLNQAPAVIEIRGSLYGEERSDFLTAVREKFSAGEPLTFVADIIAATSIQYVVIEALAFEESSAFPEQTDYYVKLRESPPPPPPPDPFGGIDTSLLDQAAAFIDGVTDVLDAIAALANMPDFSDPSALLGGALDDVGQALAGLDTVGGLLDDLFGGP